MGSHLSVLEIEEDLDSLGHANFGFTFDEPMDDGRDLSGLQKFLLERHKKNVLKEIRSLVKRHSAQGILEEGIYCKLFETEVSTKNVLGGID